MSNFWSEFYNFGLIKVNSTECVEWALSYLCVKYQSTIGQLLEFPYLNDDFHRCIYSHKCSSNIVNSLYNCS